MNESLDRWNHIGNHYQKDIDNVQDTQQKDWNLPGELSVQFNQTLRSLGSQLEDAYKRKLTINENDKIKVEKLNTKILNMNTKILNMSKDLDRWHNIQETQKYFTLKELISLEQSYNEFTESYEQVLAAYRQGSDHPDARAQYEEASQNFLMMGKKLADKGKDQVGDSSTNGGQEEQRIEKLPADLVDTRQQTDIPSTSLEHEILQVSTSGYADTHKIPDDVESTRQRIQAKIETLSSKKLTKEFEEKLNSLCRQLSGYYQLIQGEITAEEDEKRFNELQKRISDLDKDLDRRKRNQDKEYSEERKVDG